jgi:CRP-like cAMP-binding protein
MEQVFKLFDAISPLDSGLREYLINELIPMEFEKGEVLVKMDQIARYIGFIEKGVIRGYRVSSNLQEYGSWLVRDGDVFASVPSFFLQLPSTEIVQVLERTSALCLPFEKYQYMLKEWPGFHHHRAEILQKYYFQAVDREIMRMDVAYQRFCYLMKHYSDLVERVEDQYLAGFLSLTPQYYSSVKSLYFKNNPRR